MLGLPELESRLRSSVVLPVLRAGSVAEALSQAERCDAAGLDVIELTTSIPGWQVAIRETAKAFPHRVVGLGTVLGAEDARVAVSVGADFLVSPCPAPEVREAAAEIGIPLIEGGMTIREVLDASTGAIAKLFPASVVGRAFLASLRQISPAARVIPTGGIALADVGSWIQAGALAVGVGRELFTNPDLQETITKIQTSKGESR